MNIAVVDDDTAALDDISAQLQSTSLQDVDCSIKFFDNPVSLLDSCSDEHYDAVFLDIDMPEINGFDLCENLHTIYNDIIVIFITSRDDLICNAFRYRALGFVRKNHINAELQYAVETLISEYKRKAAVITVTELRSAGGNEQTIPVQNITYIEMHDHDAYIHIADGSTIITRQKLSFFSENKLFLRFISINSGMLVNTEYMTYTIDGFALTDGTPLYISRRKFQTVRTEYMRLNRRKLI